MKMNTRALTVAIVLCLTLSYLGPLASMAWAAPNQDIYIVRPGDTLYSVARRYNTDVATLQRLNRLSNPNLIRVGQRLIVPGRGGALSIATPQRTSILASPVIRPMAGTSAACLYRVQRGDTLFGLGRKFHVSHRIIARANGLPASSKLYVGQLLRIPGGDCAAVTSAVPTRSVVSSSAASSPSVSFTPASRRVIRPTPTPGWHLRAPVAMRENILRIPTPTPQAPRVRLLPTPTPTPDLRHRIYGLGIFTGD